jgi:hypothetical protein
MPSPASAARIWVAAASSLPAIYSAAKAGRGEQAPAISAEDEALLASREVQPIQE